MSSLSVLLVSASWLLTYEVLGYVWNLLPRLFIRRRLKVMLIGIPIFFVHIAGIWLYALAYFIIENFTSYGSVIGSGRQPGVNLESFLDCLYFSSATYSSLGFGDLIPTGNLRMLMAAEVLNGLVLIGWTASFTYLAMEKFWMNPKDRNSGKS